MGKWRRLRIGDICDIVKGETGLASATPGIYPLVATGAARRSCSSYQFDTEAVCIPLVSSTGHGKKTLNYVHYQSGKFALGTILAAVIPKHPQILTARYLHLYLSHFKDTVLVPLMKGAANVSLPIKGISSITIPVPPVDEQQRLIDLIGRIESEHRELLVEGEHQAELFKQLRQTVLQEAVEGKLTTDWRKQHPVVKGDPQHDAAALLTQIKAEKERLVKAGRLRNEKPLPQIANEDKPFELPQGWVWCRLGEICCVSTGKRDANEGDANGKYNFYTCAQEPIKSNTYAFNGEAIILPGNGANVGFSIYVNEEFEAYQRTYVLTNFRQLSTRYIHVVFKAIWKRNLGEQYGSAINYIRLGNVTDFLVPVPPVSEQEVIVPRTDDLMVVIDELERQVSERKEQAQMLMQAVLREAFAGGSEDCVVGLDDEADEIETPKARVRRKPVQAAKSAERQSAQSATQGNIPHVILAAMRPGQVYSRADLLSTTGITDADWTWAIRQLKDDGLVVQEGEKRGARYRLR